MSFDTLVIVIGLIGALSGVFFVLAILADLVWPALEAQTGPRRQATYRR